MLQIIRVALVSIVALANLATDGASRPVFAQPDSLVELAERLLAAQSDRMSAMALLPGTVPLDLPFQLAVPPGGRLIGSEVVASATGTAVSIFADLPGEPSALRAPISDQLLSQGWIDSGASPGAPPFGSFPPPSGFQPTPAPGSAGPQTRYCFGDDGTTLLWSALPRGPGVSAVSFALNLKSPGDSGITVCDRIEPPRPPFPPLSPSLLSGGDAVSGANLLLVLQAPEGVQIRGGGWGLSGGTTRGFGSEAIATGDRGTVELAAAFADQLVALDWHWLAGASHDALAWSTWALPTDEEWLGILYVTRLTDRQYQLAIRVEGRPSLDDQDRLPGTLAFVRQAPAPPITLALPTVTDHSLLGELVERVLARGSDVLDQPMSTARLDLGRIPPELPFALAIPEGARLLGGSTRTTSGQTVVTVIVDAHGTAGDVDGELRRQLVDQGWTEHRPSDGLSPLSIQEDGNRSSTFCRGEAGGPVSLAIRAQAGGINWVTVTATLPDSDPRRLGGFSQCSAPTPPVGVGRFGPGIGGGGVGSPRIDLPPLLAPPGVRIEPGISQSGSTVVIGAVAHTSLTSAELATHFAAQLRGGGWSLRADGLDGRFGWSAWTLPGQEGWRGLLIAHDLPGDGRSWLTVRVDPTQDPGQSAPSP